MRKPASIMARRFVWPIIMIIIIGCDNPNKKIDSLANLESIDPATRIRAIKWAGENKVHNAIPLLVDRLQEQDRTVRFYAIMALRRITGDDLGFDYKADPAQRAEAVKKWRQSLNHK